MNTLTVEEVIEELKKYDPKTKCIRADNLGGYETILKGEIKLEKGVLDAFHPEREFHDAVVIGHA